MKKVLSLVLAFAMVLGMSTMAFADEGDKDFTTNGTLTITVPTAGLVADADGKITIEVAVNEAYGEENAGGAIVPYDTLGTHNVKSLLTRFYHEDLGSLSIVSATLKNISALASTVTIVAQLPSTTAGTMIAAKNLTVTFAGDSETASIAIDAVDYTTGGTTDPGTPVPPVTGTTIPSGYKIVKVADDWYDYVSWNTKPVNGVTTEPDFTFEGKLDARCFIWEDKDGNSVTPSASWALRTTHMKDIDVRKTNPKNNSGTVASVAIDGSTLEIELVEYFLKCGDTDVTMELDLTCKGKASGSKFSVDFNIYNDEELVEDGQTYVETDNHIYLKADDSVRNLEMFIGENLYITKSFGKGQKAYARVSLELSAGDEELFHKFAELSDVYTLYTVGVNSANVTARFKDLGDTFFVYDENFKLIGTTADTKLPFSNKYYLTTAKVDLAGADVEDEDPSDESAPDDIDNVDGGGGTAPVNNYNPNTGA